MKRYKNVFIFIIFLLIINWLSSVFFRVCLAPKEYVFAKSEKFFVKYYWDWYSSEPGHNDETLSLIKMPTKKSKGTYGCVNYETPYIAKNQILCVSTRKCELEDINGWTPIFPNRFIRNPSNGIDCIAVTISANTSTIKDFPNYLTYLFDGCGNLLRGT